MHILQVPELTLECKELPCLQLPAHAWDGKLPQGVRSGHSDLSIPGFVVQAAFLTKLLHHVSHSVYRDLQESGGFYMFKPTSALSVVTEKLQDTHSNFETVGPAPTDSLQLSYTVSQISAAV